MAPWAVEEMKTADLGDERLNKRLTAVLSAFGERPTASIPAACGGRDEMVAAYRFFDNEKVGYEEVLAPHYESTLKRIAAQPLVLLIEDTSELDFTRPHEQVQGAGWLDGSSRRGAVPASADRFYSGRHSLGQLLGQDVDARRTPGGRDAQPEGKTPQIHSD